MLLIFALKNSKLENFEKKLERKAKSFRNISQLHLLLCDALCVEPHGSPCLRRKQRELRASTPGLT